MASIKTFTFGLLLIISSVHSYLTPDSAKQMAMRLSIGLNRDFNTTYLNKLQNISREFTGIFSEAFDKYPNLLRIADRLEFVERQVEYIGNAYKHISEIISYPAKFRQSNLEFVLKAFPNLRPAAYRIFVELNANLLVPSIFEILAHNPDSQTDCVTKESSANLINAVYDIYVFAEIEALVVQLYIYDIQQKLRGDSVEHEKKEEIENFVNRIRLTLEIVYKSIVKASKNQSDCDDANENNE